MKGVGMNEEERKERSWEQIAIKVFNEVKDILDQLREYDRETRE